ncbi:hypothetical protein RB614_37485 [Phytohabitans sp. ZYX-F-186]|uniref:Uncharacterized protein n=1 Tax=Phytohabitans maris TaxID=3071409 RepID=A0ABU0ZT58_9ACTN|nr:hypothetical protein [Phytohabitans sp. ZYX-F-186]MDQ7910204.1 hypothetical protein [Phytohabitans sp. ZYX-F-186]
MTHHRQPDRADLVQVVRPVGRSSLDKVGAVRPGDAYATGKHRPSPNRAIATHVFTRLTIIVNIGDPGRADMDDHARHRRLTNATSSLAGWLAPLAFDLTAAEVTSLLTVEVARWAEQYQFACDREVPSRYTRTSRRGFEWPGLIDIVGRHPNGVKLAIEIDRHTKRRSLDKLIAEAEAGAVAIWVRWFGQSTIVVPPTVGLVELRVRRVRTPGDGGYRYQRTPHLAWPAPPPHGAPVRMAYQARLFETERQPKRKAQPSETSQPQRTAPPDVA